MDRLDKNHKFSPPRPSAFMALAAGCLLAAFLWCAEAPAQGWGARPVAVRVASVESAVIPEEVSFIGTIEPNIATTVASLVSGRVAAADFREGDAVVAGKTILLQVYRGGREIALRERAAAVARAKKHWEKVKEGSRSEEVAQSLAGVEQTAVAGVRQTLPLGYSIDISVHQTLNFIRAGEAPQAALLASVRTRIRPIFMTTATAVFGMLPLVLSRGAGSELYRGLGSAVLGGLAVSTLFTLVLTPTLYSLWLDAIERMRRRPFDEEAGTEPMAAPEPARGVE